MNSTPATAAKGAVPVLAAENSLLLLIDFQARLMPAIDQGAAVLAAAERLARAARLLEIPVLATEENPKGLGGTVAPLAGLATRTIAKMAFNACAEPELPAALAGGDRRIVVAGCESHVCVLQTVLGLRALGREVALATDAVGSRRATDKAAALDRLARQGVELVTSEMLLFEWLRSCEHARFKEILAMVR